MERSQDIFGEHPFFTTVNPPSGNIKQVLNAGHSPTSSPTSRLSLLVGLLLYKVTAGCIALLRLKRTVKVMNWFTSLPMSRKIAVLLIPVLLLGLAATFFLTLSDDSPESKTPDATASENPDAPGAPGAPVDRFTRDIEDREGDVPGAPEPSGPADIPGEDTSPVEGPTADAEPVPGENIVPTEPMVDGRPVRIVAMLCDTQLENIVAHRGMERSLDAVKSVDPTCWKDQVSVDSLAEILTPSGRGFFPETDEELAACQDAIRVATDPANLPLLADFTVEAAKKFDAESKTILDRCTEAQTAAVIAGRAATITS